MAKSFTDIEQSKKLAEILPIDSADHHYVRKVTDFMGNPVDGEWSHPKYGNPNSKYANYMVQNFTSYETIPCWSLAALLDILCPDITLDHTEGEGWSVIVNIVVENPTSILNDITTEKVIAETLINACYEMIIKLHGKKVL